MSLKTNSVWLVTGASSGFGRAFVTEALRRGHRVVATVRTPDALSDLQEKVGSRLLVRELDVTDAEQSVRLVKEVEGQFGSLDVLVNNAGYGYFGAVEEGEDADIRHLFEVNVFALARLTRLALPGMRQRNYGYIVNLSSIAGLSANPGSGYYAATKFAVEALSEALAAEVQDFGIKVMILEPGLFRTDFLGRSVRLAPALEDYRGTPSDRLKETLMSVNGAQPGDPLAAVSRTIDLMEQIDPPLRFLVGKSVIDRALTKLESVWQEIVQRRDLSESAEFPNP